MIFLVWEIKVMETRTHAFVSSEISLIIEALERTAKRQQSEARWYTTRRLNNKLANEHGRKAVAMLKLVAKLQPLIGLHGVVKS